MTPALTLSGSDIPAAGHAPQLLATNGGVSLILKNLDNEGQFQARTYSRANTSWSPLTEVISGCSSLRSASSGAQAVVAMRGCTLYGSGFTTALLDGTTGKWYPGLGLALPLPTVFDVTVDDAGVVTLVGAGADGRDPDTKKPFPGRLVWGQRSPGEKGTWSKGELSDPGATKPAALRSVQDLRLAANRGDVALAVGFRDRAPNPAPEPNDDPQVDVIEPIVFRKRGDAAFLSERIVASSQRLAQGLSYNNVTEHQYERPFMPIALLPGGATAVGWESEARHQRESFGRNRYDGPLVEPFMVPWLAVSTGGWHSTRLPVPRDQAAVQQALLNASQGLPHLEGNLVAIGEELHAIWFDSGGARNARWSANGSWSSVQTLVESKTFSKVKVLTNHAGRAAIVWAEASGVHVRFLTRAGWSETRTLFAAFSSPLNQRPRRRDFVALADAALADDGWLYAAAWWSSETDNSRIQDFRVLAIPG